MRLILEIVSGPRKGRKTVLKEGQSLSVGRSEWSELCCDFDQKMSRVHFLVKTDALGCYLNDHSSRNGTLVNGMRVTDCILRSGDRIEAGSTCFTAHIEGDSPENARNIHGTTWIPNDLDSGLLKASKGSLKVTYTSESCGSGLTLYHGATESMAPALFAQIISRAHPLHLIIHLSKFDIPLPEELGPPQYLFDWLDPAAQPAASPVLVTPGEQESWKPFVDEGWGQDSVICIFSSRPAADLLAQLRALCRAKSHGADDGQAVFGYCWPGVLAPLLMHSSKEMVGRLTDGIDAMLVEFADLPETWQLFGSDGLKDVLKAFGIRPEGPEPDNKRTQPIAPAPAAPPPGPDDTIPPR